MDAEVRFFRHVKTTEPEERLSILRRLMAVEKRLDILEHKPSPKFVDDYTSQDRLRRPV